MSAPSCYKNYNIDELTYFGSKLLLNKLIKLGIKSFPP